MSTRLVRKISGITFLAGGALFGALSMKSVPALHALVQVSGQLASFTPAHGGKFGSGLLRFELANDATAYQYSSIGGDLQGVETALRQAGHAQIRILVDPNEDLARRSAFEVVVGERVIRSREQVLAGYRSNRNLGLGMAGGLALAGVLVLTGLRRAR